MKRLILLLFILATSILTAQTYRLGFNTEVDLYAETSNPTKNAVIGGSIFPKGLKMIFGYKASNLVKFDLRAGYTFENIDYFSGGQVGIYYLPDVIDTTLYGVIGINILRNSRQGNKNHDQVKESDRLNSLVNLGFGSNISKYFFVEFLYQKNLGNGIVSYDAEPFYNNDSKETWYIYYPRYYKYSIKLVLGFAWDL